MLGIFEHMDTKQLIISVVATVIVVIAKELTSWAVKRTPSTMVRLTATLGPIISRFLRKYWRIVLDAVVIVFMVILIRWSVSPTDTLKRSDVFLISFFTATLVYWQTELMRDLRRIHAA